MSGPPARGASTDQDGGLSKHSLTYGRDLSSRRGHGPNADRRPMVPASHGTHTRPVLCVTHVSTPERPGDRHVLISWPFEESLQNWNLWPKCKKWGAHINPPDFWFLLESGQFQQPRPSTPMGRLNWGMGGQTPLRQLACLARGMEFETPLKVWKGGLGAAGTHSPPAVPTAGGWGGDDGGILCGGNPPSIPGQRGRLEGAVRRNWAQLTHLPLHLEN